VFKWAVLIWKVIKSLPERAGFIWYNQCMQKNLIFISAVVLVLGAGIFFWSGFNKNSLKNNLPVACTMDAKLCSDGSAVGRTGPNCEFAKCPDVTDIPYNTSDLVLGVGENGKAGDLKITLNSVMQDSRCPSGVQCIWAGLVEVKINISGGSKSENVNISSGQTPHVFDGYSISIVSVSPVRESKKQIIDSEYRITFRILKLPDGSVVSEKGVVTGLVMLSPVCPVERIPPDPNCAPKPYQTTVEVFLAGGTERVQTIQSKSDGSFKFTLPYSDYYIEASGGSVYPRCSPVELSVKTAAPNPVLISCDTGIR